MLPILTDVFFALSLTAATSLTACDGGDVNENVVRNFFSVGDVVKGLEDGGPVDEPFDIPMNIYPPYFKVQLQS